MNTPTKKISGLLAICCSCIGFVLMFTIDFIKGIASAHNAVLSLLVCGFVLSLLARPLRRAKFALALTVTFTIAYVFWPIFG